MRTQTATFVTNVTVTDPETNNTVTLAIYKHDYTGEMFGIDKKFIRENFDDDETPTVADPFNNNGIVELINFNNINFREIEEHAAMQGDDDIQDGHALYHKE